MKKGVIILTFVFIILSIGTFFVVQNIQEKNYENTMNEIRNTRNTVLDTFNSNKALAESFLEVYQIVDENSYQMVKNDMYNHLSIELQKDIFPTAHYEGLALHTMTPTVISCIGTNNPANEENVFKLVYNLKAVNYDQDITNLITIRNGVITRVERIL